MTVASLHAVAAYVVAPARHRATGRIGLVPTETGFATPPLPDGGIVGVDGTDLVRANGDRSPLTTVRAAAAFVGIDLDAHPPIGADLPPFRPDEELSVEPDDVAVLASWWLLGVGALEELRRAGDAAVAPEQLWPEHFDLGAVAVPSASRALVNVGFSPGDGYVPEPYLYVGPQDRDSADRSWWNAPFGATRTRRELLDANPDDLAGAAVRFLRWGLRHAAGSG